MRKLMNLKNYGIYPNQPYDAEVEYLGTTGGQYINTGIIGSSATKVEVMAYSTNASSIMSLFGARNATGNRPSFCLWQHAAINSTTGIRIDYNNVSSDSLVLGTWDNTAVNTIIKDGRLNTVNGTQITSSADFTFDLPIPFFLGTINASGSPVAYYFVGHIYSCKIYDTNGILVRDLIPVRFTNELGQSEGAMYDRVTGKLFRNQGTGSFLYGPDKHKISLPYDAEVEYLESTGTQYIDTGCIANSDLSVELTMANSGTDLSNVNPLGAILVSPRYRHHLNFSITGVRYFFGSGDTAITTSFVSSDDVVFTFKVDTSARTFTLGSFTDVLQTGTWSTGFNYWLFARNGTTSPYYASLKIYAAKFWSDNILLRNMIPVRVGRIGAMYDRANPTGGPNGNGLYFSETDPLIAGPDKSNS